MVVAYLESDRIIFQPLLINKLWQICILCSLNTE